MSAFEMRVHRQRKGTNSMLHIVLLLTGIVATGQQARAYTVYQERQPQLPDQRCFPETDNCIDGPILDYWEANGGLAIFGYPITPLRSEAVEGQALPVQWFERDRLEYHGEQGVMAGRLGVELLELQGRTWFIFPPVGNAPPDCRYFPETRHSLCEPFLSYWLEHGGLERFGYPITEAFGEQVTETWTGSVQYFERRRMEWHTELPGKPILLGLLGREIWDALTTRNAPIPQADAQAYLPTQNHAHAGGD